MKKIIVSLFIVIIAYTNAFTNNLLVENVVVPNSNSINFDISWNNSWHTSLNWDAIWIFVKVQDCEGTATWDHLDLSTDPLDHSVSGGTDLTVETTTDGKGIFIKRNSNGFGSQSGNVTLMFANPIPQYEEINFHVFGVEMVWVPQGSFKVGDGSTDNETHSTASLGSHFSPFPKEITSEDLIPMDDLCNDKPSDNGITRHPEIPATFPKGFNGFYCMKYEISQQQYAVFLNKLSFIEQQTRMANNAFDPVGTLVMTTAGYQNRNGIRIKQTSGGAPAIVDVDLNGDGAYGDGNSIACNYMSWSDLLAYLDWAALRPMTELEYEKAARGPLEPILTEYVWGNTSILQAKSDELLNPGTDSEISNTSGDGLCAHGTGPSETLGPLRTGFAATATTIRTTSGASYWGIMDLSGNLQEQTISIGFLDNGVRPPISHIFIGENGDGMLDEDGNSNISTWPSANTVGAVIRRGGDWQSSSQRAQTSDRAFVNITLTERSSQVGGRGVRTP